MNGAQRIRAAIHAREAQGRGVLAAYLPANYPDPDLRLFEAIASVADVVEVGIPFSDPSADGPTLQQATEQALRHGDAWQGALRTARHLRQARPHQPLVAMTYANVLHARGWDAAARELASAGFDAAILPDVPLEEAGPVRAALRAHGLCYVPIITPTSQDERIMAADALADGFLYVAGNVGTTGQAGIGELAAATLARSSACSAPRLCGFGLSAPAEVAALRKSGADGAIVGSALVRRIGEGARPAEVAAYLAQLRDAL